VKGGQAMEFYMIYKRLQARKMLSDALHIRKPEAERILMKMVVEFKGVK